MTPLLAAELSAAAYLPPEEVQRIASERDLAFKFFSFGSSQAYLFFDEDRVICAFRGTEPTEILDVLADLRAWKTDGPFGRVHAGFQAALLRIWPAVSQEIRDNHANKTINLTGHSLGGALAVLAAAHSISNMIHLDQVITFGCPRVGDYEFTRTFEERFSRHLRFVNSCDIVARVPRWRYSTPGWLRFFDADGNRHKNPSKRFRQWDRLTCYWRDRWEVFKLVAYIVVLVTGPLGARVAFLKKWAVKPALASIRCHYMARYLFHTERWYSNAA